MHACSDIIATILVSLITTAASQNTVYTSSRLQMKQEKERRTDPREEFNQGRPRVVRSLRHWDCLVLSHIWAAGLS